MQAINYLRESSKLFELIGIEGLVIVVSGGNYNRRNQRIHLDDTLLTLTGAATNYVYIDWATQAVAVDLVAFPKASLPLYIITTELTGITGIDDYRSILRQASHTEFATAVAWLTDAAYIADTGWTDIDLSAIAPVSSTGIILTVQAMETGAIGTACVSMRKKGAANPSEEQVMWPQVANVWISATFVVGMDATYVSQYRFLPDTSLSVKVGLMGWAYGEV
jgi:hypothetical protein